MFKPFLRNLFYKFGYEVRKVNSHSINEVEKIETIEKVDLMRKELASGYNAFFSLDDFTLEEIESINSVLPYTMTGPLRTASLMRAIRYIVQNKIEGDIVECGVWKGGSMMLIAKTLLSLGADDRELYLYDTFQGMTEPTDKDVSFDKKNADDLLKAKIDERMDGNNIWCYSNLEEVRQNMKSTGYNMSKVHFIEGKVEDSIPGNLPDKTALLRLDTDWYESTLHELTYLYPLLVKKGILIIDDYGQWMGQKKAVDKFLTENNLTLYLNRIDSSSRLIVNT